MEKREKDAKSREFYIKILEQWSNTLILSRKELNKLVDDTCNELGLSANPGNRSFRVKRLEDVLGKDWLEKVEDDGPWRGRGKNYIYSLKLSKENKQGDLEKIKKLFLDFFALQDERKKRKGNLDQSQLSEEIVNQDENKEVKKTTIMYKPHRSVFEKLGNILKYLLENEKNSIDRSEISKVTGFQNFSENNLNGWISSLARVGILLDARYISGSYGKTCLKFENPKGIAASIREAAKKIYGMDIAFPGIHPGNNVITTRKVTTPQKTDNKEKARLFFAIGGFIAYNDYKPVDIDTLCKILRDNFYITATRREILDVIKGEEDFESIQYGSKIGLKDKKFSWDNICDKYGPKNYEKQVVVRLTLPKKEIIEYFPKTEMLSKISENDAVYRITYEDTKHSLSKWVRIYRRFRGPDAIFDKSLEEQIKLEIQRIDEFLYKDDIVYNIEKTNVNI